MWWWTFPCACNALFVFPSTTGFQSLHPMTSNLHFHLHWLFQKWRNSLHTLDLSCCSTETVYHSVQNPKIGSDTSSDQSDLGGFLSLVPLLLLLPLLQLWGNPLSMLPRCVLVWGMRALMAVTTTLLVLTMTTSLSLTIWLASEVSSWIFPTGYSTFHLIDEFFFGVPVGK